MNKWIKLVALMMTLFVLGGCNLIVTDPVLDAKTVIAKVGDEVITKGEVQEALDQTLYEYSFYYSLQGYTFDTSDKALVASIQEDVVDQLISNSVVQQRGKALGLDTFTAEEEADFDTQAQTQLDSSIEYAKSMPEFADSELEGDALTAEILTYLESEGITKQVYIDDLKASAIATRVRENAIADVTIPDEEVRSTFDTNMQAQKDRYAEDITAYATDFGNSADIYYTPAGFRFMKHVLVKLPTETTTRISELQSSITANDSARADLEQQLADLEAEEEFSDEEKQERSTAINAQLETLAGEKTGYEDELAQVQEDAYASILPKAQEIWEKAKLGLNFDKLVETYGEDPGMQSEPYKSSGYPIRAEMTNYDPPFQEAAMALAQVGDLSEPVQGASGYHILYFASESEEKETEYETLRQKLHDELLTTRQNETYNAALETWESETKITKYLDRLD